MSLWNCDLSKKENITVGEKLTLACQGSVEGIDKTKLQIKDAKLSDEIPSLSLLGVLDSKESEQIFSVTSYRVGDHSSEGIVFYDGNNKISISELKWNVTTVIQQDPLNPPQAYGAFPMWSMSYPIWFWIVVIALIISVILLPIRQYKKIKQRELDFEDLKNLETGLNPLDAFFKNARRMERALEVDHISANGFIDQIDSDMRVYLSRALQLPIHKWGIDKSLSEIKSKYPKIYRDYGSEIQKYQSEVLKTKKNVQKKDCIYVLDLTQNLLEKIDSAVSAKGRKR